MASPLSYSTALPGEAFVWKFSFDTLPETMTSRILFLLAAPLLWSQGKEVGQAVREIAARGAAATEYSFEGELSLVGQKGSAPGRVLSQARVTCAAAPGGKSLLRVDAPEKGEYLLASDGQKSWAYVPRLKQYTEAESAASGGEDEEEGGADSERDLAEKFARLVVPTLARMASNAEAVEQAPPAEVKFEGRKYKWPVLRVVSKNDPRERRYLTEVTVNPETLDVARLLRANVSYSGGEKQVLRLTVDFRSFRMGPGSAAQAAFTFQPPRNAKLVDAVPIPGQTGSFLLNRPAPDFELKTLEGERVRLADLRGKPVLLSFWASWCGPCRRELPGLAKLHAEFRDQLAILGVNDEGRGAARKYVNEAGLPFPTLEDGSRKAHQLYRVRSIPSVFLIDPEGKVVRFVNGSRDAATLRALLKSVGL